MGKDHHQHKHPHGHDAGVLSVYRATFPSKADVIAETSDPATSSMLEHLAELGCDTCFDRFDAQKPHCAFGLAGSCCRMCNMGPCRITAKSPVGVCGADADVIVARNLLRWVAAGVAAHAARGREVMLALKAAAEGRLDLPILGETKIRKTASALGLADEPDLRKLAGALADVLLEDLGRVVPGSHRTLHALAPAERIETWRKLGILPIGAYQEVAEALHRTSTGTDGNWRTIMDQMLRCGLAFAWSSVVGSSIAMDALYGTPKRSRVEANLGSLRDGYVNIALHGHSPVLVDAIVSASREGDMEALALQIGAKGLRLYGICCSGLSAMYRRGNVQPLANAMGAELALGTGALDLWVADMQDVYPAIMGVANCVQTPVITTSDSCHLPGAEHIAFDHDHGNLAEAKDLGRRIVREAVKSHGLRRHIPRHVPDVSITAEVGFSLENILETFHGLQPLVDALKQGTLRGIVNLVGCNNPKVMYERAVTTVADALIGHDILVLTNGCASFPLLKLGYCHPDFLARSGPGLRHLLAGPAPLPPVWHMGECLDNARASGLFRALSDALALPLRQLPFAFASPEWSNEKGVGAALSFRLLGLDSYHCVHAPILGSENVQRYLGEETRATLGGVMVVDPDPVALSRKILSDLKSRRSALGWAETNHPSDLGGTS
jgi:carbon-monoxide dehydrogenase catalytic subunit